MKINLIPVSRELFEIEIEEEKFIFSLNFTLNIADTLVDLLRKFNLKIVEKMHMGRANF